MVAWLVALVGCGTETGNPEGDVSLLYNARSRVPELVSLEPGAQSTTVSAVWLRLDAVDFTACSRKADGLSLGAIGLADHAGDEAFEQRVPSPDGPFCELSTALVPGDDGPTPLTEGASAVVEGTLSDGRSFAVVLDETVDLVLPLDEVRRPAEGAWLLSFDVGTWIDPGELATLTGDPVIVSADTRPELLATVTKRLPLGVQLHLDLDADGLVDGDPRLDLP